MAQGIRDYRDPRYGGRGDDVFEVHVHEDYARNYFIIAFRSRMFDVDYNIQLRREWRADPNELAAYIERLIGPTLRHWREMGLRSGRDMAQALMPMWEREIHRQMERLEYDAQMRRPRPMLDADIIYGHAYLAHHDWSPREDPKATEKARQLLMRNLDDGQLKSYKKDKEFRVTAANGKVYRITTARSFNVIDVESGARYCGQLQDCPIEDQMLAQKLLLQSEPDKFFSNANVAPAVAASPTYNEMQAVFTREMIEAFNQPAVLTRPGGRRTM